MQADDVEGELVDEQGERLAGLREQVDSRAQRFEQAAQQVGPVSATDASGTVQVRLDAQGAPQDVVVRDGWSAHWSPDGLGAAVLEAYGAAAAERARQWGQQTAAVLDEPEPRARPAATGVETVASRLRDLADQAPRDVDTRRSLEELAALLRSVNDQLDTAFDQVVARAEAEHEGRSGAGHVRATVTGAGALVSVTANRDWAASTHPFNLSRELTEAVAAAVGAAARSMPSNPLDGTALAEAASLFQDADALARRVGLSGS